eukprot:CAMPEP_0202453870 /NCGR_PEP_ID=MMETSP1360-20130828/11744_1 /ASSEMBLY_ACC=CAM_ASM_000848 /TAXON_ID=515479 /ORGANISM="Licmophora paradoxa, Strain CCMP2313" /LENGTH=563 /DNA_ID=CAMNT_0049073063 /DNA_START=341 /DNA_END=2032 /DNA_ORIENTATION=-
MTENEQRERRASIKSIMNDDALTPLERRRSIQSLMDGRRRSSGGPGSCIPSSIAGSMSMMAAAAAAAAEFYDSDESDDALPLPPPNNNNHRTNNYHHNDHDAYNNNPHNNNNHTNHTSSHANEDDQDLSVASSLSSYAGTSGRTSLGGGSSMGGATRVREQREPQYYRQGRSASLKAFANGAAAAAAAAAAAFSDDPEDLINTNMRMEKSRPPCDHYDRNCTIISPCCGLAFGCRICHDECPVLPPSKEQLHELQQQQQQHGLTLGNWYDGVDSRKKARITKRRSLPTELSEEDTHHQIDRFAIDEIICRMCYTRQSSKTDNCSNCGVLFGEYHCKVCNLWMSNDEDPYHCLDCGFCRVGGRHNFRHCHDCGMCIDALLFDDHNCKAGKYMSNCPVCQEDLFSSRSASHEMPCGHAIHWHCFRELTSYDTRCPVCKKTAETHEQMAPTWSAMAMGICLQPVPPEMARVVTIMCNDCEERDEDRRWHFLGVQCLKCSSFNTTIEKTTMTGREAAVFLGDDPDNVTNGNDMAMDAFIGTAENENEMNGRGVTDNTATQNSDMSDL